MTTPKNPEDVMKEFAEYKELLNQHKNFDEGDYEGDLAEAWLRSSMASLLLHMVRQMPGTMTVECDNHTVNINNMGYNKCLDDCRTLLTNEARKITNNE